MVFGDGASDRAYWVSLANRLAAPVLEAAADGRLRAAMPVEVGPGGSPEDRGRSNHFEAVSRLLCGLAAWFELPDGVCDPEEEALRIRLRDLARVAIARGVDPDAEDHFTKEPDVHHVVDAGFLALTLLRAPDSLWGALGERDRSRALELLRATRRFQPHQNNWLLFAAAVESFVLASGGDDWDPMRIDVAIHRFDSWYRGDGVYSDGHDLRWDYYNSYVIHPFLVEIVAAAAGEVRGLSRLRSKVFERAKRFAVIQERSIAPDGTFPPFGRSLAYRVGAFHALAQAAVRGLLPEGLAPGQVRAGLTAVLRRQMDVPGTFDSDGWLRIGFAGHQPSVAENYISTGSLYLCAAALLPLGLSPRDAFWTAEGSPWTSKRAWEGGDLNRDAPLSG